MAEAQLIKSDPTIQFLESVLHKSSRMVMSKSPNKHNRLYMEAQPIEEGLAEAIDDTKYRVKILSKEFWLGQGSS